MLSNTGVYALRAAIYLAHHVGEGPVRVDDVAEELDIPKNYLSKVLYGLTKAGVLSSLRGPHGGFELAVPASQVKLAQILEPFEQVEEDRTCLLGQGTCSDTDPCALHYRWRDVATEIAAFFRDTALEDVLADEARRTALLGQ